MKTKLPVAVLDTIVPNSVDGDGDDSSDAPKRDLVASLQKGLAVIEAFDQDRPRLTITEVAERTRMTRAAARRYLLTLAHLGYVSVDRKMFSLTPKVLRLGQSYMHSARLPRIVQPQLYKLAYAMQEAASAGVLDVDDVICIASTSAGQVISATLQPGTRGPAYCTANGRVLLAALKPGEIDDWLTDRKLDALTEYTIVNKDRLRVELARTAAQGYALVDQELELGLRTLAVPLRNYGGNVVAAMNISVHASRLGHDELRERGLPMLLQAQAQLRSLL